MSLGRKLKDLRYDLFYLWALRSDVPVVTLGGECPWTLCDRGLGPISKVLCAGAGHDISFERALIEDYGCRVVLLDPSPTGVDTVRREALPAERLNYQQVGLADRDGEIDFQAPADAREGSFVGVTNGGSAAALAHRFACKTLGTLLREFSWHEIDLLKIDIEGCEYAVLRQMLGQRIPIRQLCVEFHHGPHFGRNSRETVRLILALRRAGYDLIHRHFWDHTFLRREP